MPTSANHSSNHGTPGGAGLGVTSNCSNGNGFVKPIIFTPVCTFPTYGSIKMSCNLQDPKILEAYNEIIDYELTDW
jgi:hypothetical protein